MTTKNAIYYLNPRMGDEGDDAIYIRGVGLHETIEGNPQRLGGPGLPQYCLMFFHTRAWVSLRGEPRQEAGGSFILWERQIICEYGLDDGLWDHTWLVIGGSAIGPLVQESGIVPNRLYPNAEAGERFLFYCREFYREVCRPGPPDQKMLSLQTELMFHDLPRILNTGQGIAVPPAFLELENYMESHLQQNIALRDLAARVYLSVPRFCALCRRHFGLSPMALLNHKRMQHAALLLQSTDLAVGEVGRRCGFPDALYFSSRFRKYWKVSPRQFRTRGEG